MADINTATATAAASSVLPSGAQLAIEALEAHGVETVFGIPGVHTLALYDALRGSNIRHVLGRHEQGVVIGISGSLSSIAMAFAPPTGGAMLEGHWLLAWALVPATVVTLGLIVTLTWPGPRRAPSPAAAASATDAPSKH